MSECGAARSDVDRQAAFHELLSAVTRAPDVREIFPHLGKTIGRIIPHAEADLAIIDNGVLTHCARISEEIRPAFLASESEPGRTSNRNSVSGCSSR
jgi:hypothetical protein